VQPRRSSCDSLAFAQIEHHMRCTCWTFHLSTCSITHNWRATGRRAIAWLRSYLLFLRHPTSSSLAFRNSLRIPIRAASSLSFQGTVLCSETHQGRLDHAAYGKARLSQTLDCSSRTFNKRTARGLLRPNVSLLQYSCAEAAPRDAPRPKWHACLPDTLRRVPTHLALTSFLATRRSVPTLRPAMSAFHLNPTDHRIHQQRWHTDCRNDKLDTLHHPKPTEEPNPPLRRQKSQGCLRLDV
jgi:hypothetical protein